MSKQASEYAIKFLIYLFYVLKWSLDHVKGRTTGYGKHPRVLRSLYWTFLKWPLDHAEGRMTGYGKHPEASRSLYQNLSLSTEYKLNFRQV
jgi:hypothetical protein